MKNRLTLTLIMALLAISTVLYGLKPVETAQAAPLEQLPVRTWTANSSGITASTQTTSRLWAGGYEHHAYADAFLFLDVEPTATNTATVVLQVSPDGTNWVNRWTLASSAAADANAYTATNVIGQYWRYNITLVGSNLITPVIKTTLRP